MTGPAGPEPVTPGPVTPGRPLPDEAYAAALASLPDMTPQRLQRILGDRDASEVCGELAHGSERLVESLLDLSSLTRRGTDHPAGGPPYAASGSGSGDLEVAGELERRRPRIREVLDWWAAELERQPVAQRWSELGTMGISVLRRGRPGYPTRLLRSPAPPEVLYVRGLIDHAELPCVGIVGTRRATLYGREVAAEFGAALSEMGIVVVSGLARGIDSAAHEGALAPAGVAAPLAVAGTGVDVVFPRGNERLWARVAAAGGIISESPPGSPPEGWRFPLRNRIIAAVSQVLLVVESSRQGGAMHTVQAADDVGVPVLAIPGSIRSPQSEGTNAIIRDGGAGLATDVEDVLAALALANEGEGSIPLARATRPRAGGGGSSRRPPPPPSPGGNPRRTDSPSGSGSHSGSPGSHSGSPGSPSGPSLGRSVGGPRSQTGSRRTRGSWVEPLLRACSDSERAAYAALDVVASPLEAVCRRSGLTLGATVLALDRLEELRLAAQVGSSWVRRE